MNKFKYILTALAAIAAASCAKEFNEITEVPLKRCLEPMDLKVTVDRKTGYKTTFEWKVTKDAEAYILDVERVFEDENGEAAGRSRALYDTIPARMVPFVTEDIEPGGTYTFMVRGISSTKDDSAWAKYEKTFKTFAVKDPLGLVVLERTANSITVSWSKELADYMDVSDIVATPAHGEGEIAIVPDAAALKAATATVSNLEASTQYEITLFFKGAIRGNVSAWTLPDYSQAVELKDTAHFRALVEGGADKLVLPYGDTAFVIKNVVLNHPLTLLGKPSADGEAPVVTGHFRLKEGANLIRLESLNFDGELNGQKYQYGRLIQLDADIKNAPVSIDVINCKMVSYVDGLYYGNKEATVSSFTVDGLVATDFKGSGGEFIDIRKGSYGSMAIRNSTFDTGGRVFLRIDKDLPVTSLVFENNTVNTVASSGNSLLYVRGEIGSYTCANNLFLNETGRLLLKDASCKVPVFKNNWFYNCGAADSDFFKSAQSALDGDEDNLGTNILKDDPCNDVAWHDFTVVNEDLVELKVGDPRWLVEVEKVPEDLTQDVTKAVKTWDLTDSEIFRKAAKEDMVRDGIRFYVQNTPVIFEADGFLFSGAATLAAGAPVDCGIGIKVDEPGALVLTTGDAGDAAAMAVVSRDGKPAIGIPVSSSAMKVIFDDIAAETMIYVYGTGAVKLKALTWTDEIDDSAPAPLANPELSINAETFNEDAEGDVTVSWTAVPKAASYAITLDGVAKDPVTEPSWSMAVSALTLGKHTVGVTAQPDPSDKKSLPSEEVTVSFNIREVLKPVTVETKWDSLYFHACADKFGKNVVVKADYVENNMGYVNGGGSGFKYDRTSIPSSENAVYRCQMAGSGTYSGGVTKCGMQIQVAGPGTFEIHAASGSNTDDRKLILNGVEYDVPAGKDGDGKVQEPRTITIEVDAAGKIGWCSKSGGINVFYVKWTPKN
ncbi:MAG: DUF4957 domain-containing protein [Bacteroidales bacterium]|nr:DUF4957 domain-containing protein [Bacteroidales bacterium]